MTLSSSEYTSLKFDAHFQFSFWKSNFLSGSQLYHFIEDTACDRQYLK